MLPMFQQFLRNVVNVQRQCVELAVQGDIMFAWCAYVLSLAFHSMHVSQCLEYGEVYAFQRIS